MLMRPPGSLPEPEQAWRDLAADLSAYTHLLLAVSGGPDSLAMLAGLARLQAAGLLAADLLAVTVDHGLRPESAEEARMVAATCDSLGVAHRTVRLDGGPDGVNLQGWARQKRYEAMAGLLNDWAPDGRAAIVTGHMAEDQAETFLMRAARGTGCDGLAGIRPVARLEGARVIRPFLAWPRARLHLAMAGSDLKPVLDPSNADSSFTRVRFRDWLARGPQPDGSRPVALGLEESARIALLESEALDVWAARLLVPLGDGPDGLMVGTLAIDDIPLAVLARLLQRAMATVSRAPDAWARLDLARMIGWADAMARKPSGKAVCAGAVLEWRPRDGGVFICAYAEAGRTGFPETPLPARDLLVWDARFEVTNASDRALSIRTACAGDDVARVDGVPAAAWQSLPVAVDGDAVVAGVAVRDMPDGGGVTFRWLPPALLRTGRLEDGGTMPQADA